LLSLFELAGASGLEASFGEDSGVRCRFHPNPECVAVPEVTHTVTFGWEPGVLSTLPLLVGSSARKRLHALVRRDPLAAWSVERAAAELGSSVRSLQRALHGEDTTFSATVQRARVACAEALLGNAQLSLTEIAFCSGFVDQAHFTRTFRKYTDVPPSVLRETTNRKALFPEELGITKISYPMNR
jgi:AraC-like DNA-binding protein